MLRTGADTINTDPLAFVAPVPLPSLAKFPPSWWCGHEMKELS